MTNKPRGVLYIGVTADIAIRVDQHKQRTGSAFCRKYNLVQLVHVERHDDIVRAIEREKALKAWKREWKVRLIEESNPEWRDLAAEILWPTEIPAFAGMTRNCTDVPPRSRASLVHG